MTNYNDGKWHGHSIEAVKSLIDYNAETGILTWRERWASLFSDGNTTAESNCAAWNRRYAGTPALNCKSGKVGHLAGSFLGLKLKAHHAAWIIYYGNGPKWQIDHIDRNPENNSIENLREANNSQNNSNKAAQKNNKLGIKGVSFRKDRGKYQALICANGVRKNLGMFNTAEEAAAAYLHASKKMHGEYRNIEPIHVREVLE